MARIVYFYCAPWVLAMMNVLVKAAAEIEHSSSLPSTDTSAINFDDFFRADDGERHEATELGVLFDGVFVVFFDVVGEVVAILKSVIED